MTQINGHPTTPPVTPPLPNPEPKVLKRVLFVEETTSDGMREVWEVTDEMLTEECLRRGLLTDAQCEEMLSGNYADSGPANEPARDTERPPLSPESAAKLHAGIESAKSGESVYLGSFAEGAGKLPSERVKELAAQLAAKATKEGKFRDWGNPDDEDHWIGLLRMLDERLGPAKEKKSLRQAVEARVGGQFHSIGDAAMAKLNALIEVLEERLP